MSKKYKIILIILGILIAICVALLAFKYFVFDKNNKKPAVTTSIVDKMDDYGYVLDDKDSKLFKEKYYELKDILEKEEIDYNEYGKKIAELFVIDLLTMSTKINKYDVGGVDYLYESEMEMYKNKVIDTLYSDMEDNSYDTRKQELPTVSAVEITEEKEIKYEIDKKKYDGYQYTIDITYEKDLKYDKKVNVTVIKDGKKMYIVEYATTK